jgi:hypothetical protein
LPNRLPWLRGQPATAMPRSLIRNGTPFERPVGQGPCRLRRASSKPLKTNALRVGLCRSIRAIAASTSSAGVISFFATSAARPRPS